MSGVVPCSFVLLYSVVRVSIKIQWILMDTAARASLLIAALAAVLPMEFFCLQYGMGDHRPSDRIPSLFD